MPLPETSPPNAKASVVKERLWRGWVAPMVVPKTVLAALMVRS